MDLHLLAPFLMATLLLLMTPGPVMGIVAHNTLRGGATGGLLTAMGVELGELCLLGVTFVGLVVSGELMPELFRWLSLAGALYLFWLAAGALRSRYLPARSPMAGSLNPIVHGLAIAFGNPAALVFYAAFFPQFMNPEHPIAEQMLRLGAIYLCTALVFDLVFVLAFARIRLPASGTRMGGFVELGSAAVYLVIAVVTVLGFMEASS